MEAENCILMILILIENEVCYIQKLPGPPIIFLCSRYSYMENSYIESLLYQQWSRAKPTVCARTHMLKFSQKRHPGQLPTSHSHIRSPSRTLCVCGARIGNASFSSAQRPSAPQLLFPLLSSPGPVVSSPTRQRVIQLRLICDYLYGLGGWILPRRGA